MSIQHSSIWTRLALTVKRIFKLYDLKLKHLPFSFDSLAAILRFGVPLAVTNTLYPLANLQIQSAINSFGSAAVAGSSASTNIEGIAGAFTGSFANATSVFMSQNIGANLPDRVKKSFFHNLWLAGFYHRISAYSCRALYTSTPSG